MKKRLLCEALMMFSLVSCDVFTEYTKTAFIDAFYDFSGISLEAGNCKDGNPYILVYPKDIMLDEPPYYYDNMIFNYTAVGGGKDQNYNRLVESYGDNSYPKEKVSGFRSYPIVYAFPDERITGIDVIAKSDYDSEHKEGSNLNDIIHLASVSLYKYIRSGYNDNVSDPFESAGNWFSELFDKTVFFPPYYPVYLGLADANREDLILLGKGRGSFIHRPIPGYREPRNPEHEVCYLIFDKKPEQNMEVEVVITLENGTLLKNSIHIAK